jgi:hypothetical protein
VVQPESAQRVDDEDGSTDSNPLATLARQIRSERDDSSNAPSDTSSSTRRQPQQIEQSIERLRAQIKELDQPIPSTTESDTRMARQRLTQLEKEYTALESSLDVASRAVTLWLGRRVAFEGSDVALDGVSGAEQFGAYSVLIKEKLSLITDLAYQYREKADDAELHPEDPRIKTELEAIQRRREQAKRELAQEIRKVIDTTLSKSYKDYESLKIQRDLLWLDLQAAKQELEVQAGLADRDPQKRQQLRVALVEKLEFEQLALETARQNARGGLASR